MKIGIDISLTIGERAGCGYYASNLVEYLAKIDNINQYILYPFFYYIRHPDFKNADKPKQKNFSICLDEVPKQGIDDLWEYCPQKKRIFGHVDILHSTSFCAPQDFYGRLIVTIYDVSFITLPECHIEENRQHCLKGTIDAITYADAIITISHHAKSEIIKYFHAPEDKIFVVHLAARDNFTPSIKAEIDRVLKKFKITKKFIFFLGTSEPRKNLKRIIEAYLSLPSSIRDNYLLVLGGGGGWLNSDLFHDISDQDLTSIYYLGYIDEKDLPAIYSGCHIFLYPSLYEGFGLPILEAMACGAPVISSNTSSMPEVCGDAAILINPMDVTQLRNSIELLIGDDGLRKSLIIKGIENAKRFSWEKTAQETLKIYQNVYEKGYDFQ